MDARTIDAYDQAAARYAAQWREQAPPADMYGLLERYFLAGGRSADIGCGAGRDVGWLNAHGFSAVGYDASEALLRQARAEFPGLEFIRAAFPDLAGIADETYDNVLCETVIMHLVPQEIGTACRRLLEILKPGGVLYLSWRVSQGDGQRDGEGRLYSAFDSSLVAQALQAAEMLHDEESLSESSGKRVHRRLARRR